MNLLLWNVEQYMFLKHLIIKRSITFLKVNNTMNKNNIKINKV